ncbi:MAG: hypothetical protein ACE5JQ_12645 [Candidatus Methylomirabilales bacterium]
MVLFLGTFALAYLIDAVLVGIAWFAVCRRFGRSPAPLTTVWALLAIFAALDLYWWPAILALDMTFTIGNESIARFLEFPPNSPADALLDVDFFDLFLWFIQVGIALWIGRLVVIGREGTSA